MNKEEFRRKMLDAMEEVGLTEDAKEWMSNFIVQEVLWNMLKKIGVEFRDM